MSRPRVSVVIPAYNRAGTILRAIRSVQEQTFQEWELLVVDDASTDETCGVVESVQDPRIRILRECANVGPSAARQRGLDAARGEFVAFLDSDDEWLPEKIARQIESKDAVVSCGYFVRQGEEEWRFIHPPVDDWVKDLHLRCMLRAGSTLLTRRESALAVGGFDPCLRYYEDWDLALRLAEQNPLRVIGEPLARIHVGPSRSAIAAESSIREFLRKHDAAFLRVGKRHRRKVRGQHLQNLAASAFAARQFGIGAKWLLESFTADPFQNPARLAALVLAPLDAALGTSFIDTAGARVRRSMGANDSKAAP